MKIGIRAHDLGKGTIKDISLLAKNHGINYLQLVLSKAIIDDDGLLNEDKAKKIYDVLEKDNIKVAMMGAYFNPVHSKEEVVSNGINKFKNHLKYAHLLNCKYVGTETGSYNDDSWTYNSKNRTEEAYQKVLEVMLDLCKYSLDYDTKVTCEGAYGHVIYAPEVLKRLVDDCEKVYPGQIKVIVDLYNYLSYDNHAHHLEILQKAIELMKDKIVIFHLKDYMIIDGKLKQVCIGKGFMDYPKILNMIKIHCPDAYLIFEGVTGFDINESLNYICKYIKEEEHGSK